MKNRSKKTAQRWWLLPMMVACVLCTSCREDYYLDEKEPTWLGESIYEFLDEEGTYTYFVRLINDLDYTEVLSKTGSKTLFVVDDATFDAFFANNAWGVSSYDELSDSHKKLLLNSSMLNNVYFSDMLGYASGRLEGRTIRRTSAGRRLNNWRPLCLFLEETTKHLWVFISTCPSAAVNVSTVTFTL